MIQDAFAIVKGCYRTTPASSPHFPSYPTSYSHLPWVTMPNNHDSSVRGNETRMPAGSGMQSLFSGTASDASDTEDGDGNDGARCS